MNPYGNENPAIKSGMHKQNNRKSDCASPGDDVGSQISEYSQIMYNNLSYNIYIYI